MHDVLHSLLPLGGVYLIPVCHVFTTGAYPGGDLPPKSYESNFIHHDFLQFEKQHLRYKAILPSIVLSQQFCEVYFISLTVVNP